MLLLLIEETYLKKAKLLFWGSSVTQNSIPSQAFGKNHPCMVSKPWCF